MGELDPYATFKNAFNTQQKEIDSLFKRVSLLEDANTEVLGFIDHNGDLPPLNGSINTVVGNKSSNSCRKTLSEYDFNDSCQVSTTMNPSPELNDFLPEIQGLPTLMYKESSTTASSISYVNLISQLMREQTVGLENMLKALGLDPITRYRLLMQIQSNISTILALRMTQTCINPSCYEEDPSTARRETIPACQGDTTPDQPSTPREVLTQSKQPTPCSSPANSVSCTNSSLNYPNVVEIKEMLRSSSSISVSSTNTYSTASAAVSLREKRRQELVRVNQRLLPVLTAVNSRSLAPNSGEHLIELNSMYPFGNTTNTEFSTASKLSQPGADSNEQYLDDKPIGLCQMSVSLSNCPCNSPQTCPIPPRKQLFLTGFTHLAAVFRGHLVRQLWATHKVRDLIRTIKDTAKLALSIHIERQNTPKHQSDDPIEAASSDSQEFMLEARLLTQLRGSMHQLYDIFLTWPKSKQISLLHIARSLPPRSTKQLTTNHPQTVIDESLSEDKAVFHTNSTTSTSKTLSENSTIACSSGVLKPIQSDQVDRHCQKVVVNARTVRSKENFAAFLDKRSCSPANLQKSEPNHEESETNHGTKPQIYTDSVVHSSTPRSSFVQKCVDKRESQTTKFSGNSTTTLSRFSLSESPTLSAIVRSKTNRDIFRPTFSTSCEKTKCVGSNPRNIVATCRRNVQRTSIHGKYTNRSGEKCTRLSLGTVSSKERYLSINANVKQRTVEPMRISKADVLTQYQNAQNSHHPPRILWHMEVEKCSVTKSARRSPIITTVQEEESRILSCSKPSSLYPVRRRIVAKQNPSPSTPEPHLQHATNSSTRLMSSINQTPTDSVRPETTLTPQATTDSHVTSLTHQVQPLLCFSISSHQRQEHLGFDGKVIEKDSKYLRETLSLESLSHQQT